MSEIKRLLHKYLSEDAIIVLALEEKADDVGYQVKQGFIDPKTGRITKKGKVDVEKHNHLHEKHFKKDAEKTYNQTNLQNLRDLLRKYLWENPEINPYKGLTESEQFAFRHVFYAGIR